ncbi:protein tesmin/TSO1-like CXC 3 isoform X3 [Jatropha curcas]|uniref:protein tesmin/TSO1-like CXC 3 isoform X3 n=1 Tax=Jatropha curcas TaxID=180498 RepID=UPI0009D69F83|nr:protein tesmin/TSO1-like CXC 3 isoform X3 [Jatropha curcas]
MDSPKENRIPPASSSSPTVQESALFNYLTNLSPIKSVKGARYVQRFSQTNFSIPQPVFTSPRVGQHRQTSFIKREEIDLADSDVYVHGDDTHLKSQLIHCYQKEDQLVSPSEYLADPAEMEENTNSTSLQAQPHNDRPKILETGFTSHEDTTIKNDDHDNSNMFLVPFSGAQHHEQFAVQAADGQDSKDSGNYLSFHQPLQSVQAYKNSAESSRSVPRGSSKADQHQRGIRRHLQFGVTIPCKHTDNDAHDNANLSLPEHVPNFESLVPHQIEPSGIFGSWLAGSHAQAITFLSSFCPSQSLRSAQNCVNHDMSAACTPSVLGLPSSSFTISGSVGSDSKTSMILACNLHAQEEKQMPNRTHTSANDLASISISSVSGEIHACMDDDHQENQAAATQQVVPYEGRMITSQNTDMVEELYQASPKQSRKRTKPVDDSEGCRRCNCKRSKCLKLYCECFAAGVYCVRSCTCENCFNRPEYEDTVLDTRQQIQARNPLAFAPKVVIPGMNSPANLLEDGNWTTPSSARHKRGCNCKKSKCLKKYCECYQAKVGCSSGCRCEGCNNSFGKKTESIYRSAEKWENISHEQLETLESPDGFVKAGRAHQVSSTWEELAGMSHMTPMLHHHLGAVATSAFLNIGDGSKASQTQARQGSTPQSSAVYLHCHHSPSSLTPKSYGTEALTEISSDSLFYNILKEDDTPEALKYTFTPTKAVKVTSPNQKRVSPPQNRSQELRSSSSQGLQSGRKFILPAVPSFPPLTPYSKLKDENQQTDGDNQDNASCP